ncbi:PIG-X [Mrakia frigida]|uniref:PIG-X/PBN1 family protein n=1 Tax=Mrakia frigida TaxID=29902 RepID=UPI003FCC0DD2
MPSHQNASLVGGLGDSPIVKRLPKSPDGEGLTRAELALLREREADGCGGGGGMGSSPIVAALPRSQEGEGLSREDLRILKSNYPISTFRNLTSSSKPSPTTFSSSLSPARSFHSSLLTTLSDLPSAPPPSCTLTFIYHFPSSIILDPYQIAQLHEDGALSSPRTEEATWRFFGETELELPVGRVGKEGNGLVLEFGRGTRVEKVEIPVHGRYLEVLSEGEEAERKGNDASREVEIEWPWVGWVCGQAEETSASGHALPNLPPPFPSSLAALFPNTSTLHSIEPVTSVSSPNPVSILTLPVGRASHLPYVEAGTTAAIWLTAGWVAWKAFRSFSRASPVVVDVDRKAQ